MPANSTPPPAPRARRWTYTHVGLVAQLPLLWCSASLALGRSPMPAEPTLWSMLLAVAAFVGAAVGLRESLALVVAALQRRLFGVQDPERRRGLWAMYLADTYPPLRGWVAAGFVIGASLTIAGHDTLPLQPSDPPAAGRSGATA